MPNENHNENLTAALQGTLKALDDPTTQSPLTEATPDSIDLLLDRINAHLVAGAPEEISDAELLRLVEIYRAQALKWQQDEQIKQSKRPRKSDLKDPVDAMDLGI